MTREEKIIMAVEQVMPLLRDAGVLSLYIAANDHQRDIYSPKQVVMSNLLEQLCELTGVARK